MAQLERFSRADLCGDSAIIGSSIIRHTELSSSEEPDKSIKETIANASHYLTAIQPTVKQSRLNWPGSEGKTEGSEPNFEGLIRKELSIVI